MQQNFKSATDIPPTPAARAAGKVCLVGAGPGDPELLTLKAVKRIRSADVLLHDALVSLEVLALASPDAQIVNVGKRCGQKNITQQEINALLVNFAAEGNFVVRLKSGDPLVFGRGSEEIDALRQAGVEVEVVPGVTAALAAAAAATISLTDRRCADQLLLVSAHHAHGKESNLNLRGIVSPRTTIAVYMPGKASKVGADLIRAGLSCQTPCIVVSMISLPGQQSYKSTLGDLCDAVQLPSPCLVIVGDTTAASSAGDLPLPYRRKLVVARLRPG